MLSSKETSLLERTKDESVVSKEMVVMNTIFKTLNSINDFSKKMILYSSCGVLIACIIGICLIAYNSAFAHEVELFKLGSTLIQKSSVAFAELIIGALAIDWFNTKFQSDD